MSTATAKKPSPPKTTKVSALKTAPKAAPKTAAKPAAKTSAKPAEAVADKPAVKVEKAVSAPTAGGTLRAKDLVARVAQATGAKVKDIKATVEATLAELGRALDAGEALNLPPLGKVKITPAKGEAGSAPMKLKLRRGTAGGGKNKQPKEALAETGEDS